jgi:hypothetical protein
MTTAEQNPEETPAVPAVGIPLDRRVGRLVEKLRDMQRHGSKSDLTVICKEAADALTELMEWRKLRDPVTLHVSLLRGFPARLDRSTFLHLAGDEKPNVQLERQTRYPGVVRSKAGLAI